MADNGFNISDLLISKGSQLIIPPLLREKQQFSKKNCKRNTCSANNCTDKGLLNFEWGISNNHEGLT